MEYVEITINNIDAEATEAVSDLFNRYGIGGAIIETLSPDFAFNTIRTVIPAEDDDVLQKIEIGLALMAKALPHGLPKPAYRFVGEQDWAEAWKEHFHVVHIGERVVIQPSWREYTPKSADVVIRLDPGMAFGSGLHPTTQLCLRILQSMPLEGVSLFDVGTGSGILSIAAARLGAAPIRAVDVDEVALQVANENFALNGLSEIETAFGSAASHGKQAWTVIVANILSNILIDIMAELKGALAPNGRLILSGIINEQEPPFLDCLAEHQLAIHSRQVEGDWIAFVVTHQVLRG